MSPQPTYLRRPLPLEPRQGPHSHTLRLGQQVAFVDPMRAIHAKDCFGAALPVFIDDPYRSTPNVANCGWITEKIVPQAVQVTAGAHHVNLVASTVPVVVAENARREQT